MNAFQRSTHTLFFAYGSNMDHQQIAARCTRPEVVTTARLDGHRLDFFGYSKVWDGGVETIVSDPGSEVWGVVYRLTIGDSNRLDSWQDVRLDGTGAYFHCPAEVVDPEGGCHVVLLYKKAIQGEGQPPSRPYLDHIVRAAQNRGLPEPYRRRLEAVGGKESSYPVPKKGSFDRSLLVDMDCSGCG